MSNKKIYTILLFFCFLIYHLFSEELILPSGAEEVYIYWSITSDDSGQLVDSGSWHIFYDSLGSPIARMSYSPLRTIYGPFAPPENNKGRDGFEYHLKPIDIQAWNGVLSSLKHKCYLGASNGSTGTTSKLKVEYFLDEGVVERYEYQFSGDFIFVMNYIETVEQLYVKQRQP